MTFDELKRLTAPLFRQVATIFRRGDIVQVDDSNPIQTLQVKLMRGELRNEIERPQEYGLNTVPLENTHVLVAALDGEPGHIMVINTHDRRHRPQNQPPGSSQLYTYANRKDDADTEYHIRLDPKSRHIHGVGKTVIFEADEEIVFRTRDGQNFIRINTDGIHLRQGGGLKNGGADVQLGWGNLWLYAAREINKSTTEEWVEESPVITGGGKRGLTMPE